VGSEGRVVRWLGLGKGKRGLELEGGWQGGGENGGVMGGNGGGESGGRGGGL